MPRFEVGMCHDFLGNNLWTTFPSSCNQGIKIWTNLCKRKVQTKYSNWETLTGLDFLCWHTHGGHQSIDDHLPPFSKRHIFQWSEEVQCPGRTHNFIKDFQSWTAWNQTTTRENSAKYPLAIIYSRVKFWVGSTKNFNQPQLSLLLHGVHQPRRTTCILFLNLSSLPPSKLFMGLP